MTGKTNEESYLRSIGATDILARQSLDLSRIRPLEKATWAGAVDNLGGDVLAWILASMKDDGTVSSIGLAADFKLNTTVMPLILRGVQLLGTNSANTPMALRQSIWDRLSREWKPTRTQEHVVVIDFHELPSVFESFLQGKVVGRTVVKIS